MSSLSCPRCGHVLEATPAPPPPLPPSSYPSYPAVARRPPRRARLTARSVPRVLLGLGATCLLVAAVIFLAVAWSSLGVGGRTAVLVAVTGLAGGAALASARRGLTVAAESLTVVAVGLVVLDVVGAQRSGWLPVTGDLRTTGLVGAALLLASTALLLSRPRLVCPQLSAPVGLLLLAVGVADVLGHVEPVAAGAVVVLAAVATEVRLTALRRTAVAAGVLAWSALGLTVLVSAVFETDLRGLWLGGTAWWWLVAAGLALLPAWWGGATTRTLSVGTAVSALTLLAAWPAVDEGASAIALVASLAAAGWGLAATRLPGRWRDAAVLPMAFSLVALAPVPAVMLVDAAQALLSVGAPYSVDAGTRLVPEVSLAHPLVLPVAVAAALIAVGRRRWLVVGAGWLTAVAVAVLYGAPLWLPVLALGPVGVLAAWPSAVLTAVTLAEVALGAGLLLRHRAPRVTLAAGTVLPLALVALTWTLGELVAAPASTRSLVALVVVGLLALARPRHEVEATGWLAVLVVGATVVDGSDSLALHLTLAGALITASALVHRDRRRLAWVGGVLLVLATWVRLADVGVHAPEPYTLPAAEALLLVGLVRLRRDPRADTLPVLLPGLSLAVVPSLVWALSDPVSVRALGVGVAALVLLLAGARLRWTAPVVVGAVSGGLLVLWELAPYAAQLEQWVVIGAAGTVLVAAGLTWEARLRELQQAVGQLRRLR